MKTKQEIEEKINQINKDFYNVPLSNVAFALITGFVTALEWVLESEM